MTPGISREEIVAFTKKVRSIAPSALRTLEEICDDGFSEAARITAAKEILDRAYGKSRQAVEISGPNEGPILTVDPSKISTEALRQLVAATNPNYSADDDDEALQSDE